MRTQRARTPSLVPSCLLMLLLTGPSWGQEPDLTPRVKVNETKDDASTQAVPATLAMNECAGIYPAETDCAVHAGLTHAPAPLVFPPLPPNATMGQFPSTLEGVADQPIPPDWLAPYLTSQIKHSGTLVFYGFLRGDLDFATSRFSNIQAPYFVLPAARTFAPKDVGTIAPRETNYSLYPRLTRLGFEYFHKPLQDLGDAKLWGHFEIDFLTTGFQQNPESRELLRMRLAYAALRIEEFTFVVGQDWDIFSPLLPSFNTNTQNANASNMGDRRPCAYISWDHDFGAGNRLQIQNGIALGDAIDSSDLGQDGFRDQESSGIPGYEARIGVIVPTWVLSQPLIAGISGVMVSERASRPVGKLGRTRFAARGLNLDLRVPLTDWLTVQSEAWTGRNLDDFRGGIQQGVNVVTGNTIEASGGWLTLDSRLSRCWQTELGMGVDKPVASDIPLGGRTRNLIYWAGTYFRLDGNVTLGVEYSYWMTYWKGLDEGQSSWIKFYAQANF